MDGYMLTMGYIMLSVLAVAFVGLLASWLDRGLESAPHRTGSGLAD